jgi:hypothetical protein
MPNRHLRNIEAMRQQGATDKDIDAYLKSVGAIEVSETKEAPSWLGTQARATAAGVAGSGLRTLSRIASALDVVTPKALESGMGPEFAQMAERFAQKIAPEDPRRRAEFESGAAGAELATEVLKFGGASKLAGQAPQLARALGATRARAAAPAALGTVEDIGTPEEQSIASLLATGAEKIGATGVAGQLQEMAGTPGGRALVGTVTGFIPEIAQQAPKVGRAIAAAPAQMAGDNAFLQAGGVLNRNLEQVRNVTPETNPARLLPAEAAGVPRTTVQYEGPAGPGIPARGKVLEEDINQRLMDAATLAKIPVEEPLIEVIESGRRTRQQQTAYVRSVKKTADRLEREARRRRALPSPDMDAIAQIETAAEAGRRLAAAQGDGSKLILPGFATYDIGGAAAEGLKLAAREPVTGALVGGGVGALTADEGDVGQMVERGVLGAAAGAGASALAGRRLAAQRKPVPGATAPVETRTRYEQKLADGTVGRTKDAAFNRSVQLLDPTGKRLWQEEEKALAAAGMTRRVVSDAEIDQFAKDIDIDDLVKRDVRKLDTVQIAALGRRIREDRTAFDDVLKKLDDTSLSAEARTQLEETRDAAFERLLSYDRIYNTAAEEQGRGLRMLGRMMRQAGSSDINQAYRMAKQALSLPNSASLSESVQASIRDVFTNPKFKTAAARDGQLAKVLGDLQQSSMLDVFLDSRAAGFLSAPHSVFTNIYGSTLGAASNAIANPIAAALDNALVATGLAGQRSVVAGSGRATTYAKAFKERLPTVMDKRWYQGLDPEKPLAEMQRKKVNYINGLGLSPQEGEAAWRKTLRPAAKMWEAANNAIYGLMTSTDAPFFQAAQSAALKERAVMRAMREMPKQVGTPKFLTRVEELMDPMTANPVDATMALAEAMDATFKTPTRMARMARELGPLGRYLSPFTNTVTNLVRRGFEDLPFVGFIPAEAQARKLGERLRTVQKLKATPEDVAREMQRYRTRVAGRQLTTGLGAISVGYLLAKSGRLTGEYVSPIGASTDEREEIARQRLTGQAPLTLRVGDTSYSLAPFAFLIPGIVVGAALADASKDDDFEVLPAAGRAAATMGRTVADLPMLQGVQNFGKLLAGEGRFGVRAGQEAASFIPFSSAIGAVARATDPESAKRRPETFTEAVKEKLPGLRSEVAPAVGPLGETMPGPSTMVERINVVANPFRPARVRTGALYEALQELDAYPTSGKRRTAGDVKESERQYAERRQLEGPAEQALLQGLIDGDPRAWAFVPPGARRKFLTAQQREQTPEGAWRELLSAALSKQRGSVTEYATQQAERQAQIEGYRPKTVPFDQRVKLILAGQP